MEKRNFEDSDILMRNEEEIMFSEVDGESVIMHLQSGRYFGLNAVSTDIWNHLENNITFPNLIDLLLAEYDVEREQCAKETEAIITMLLNMKFIFKKE